jgi:hypothetical protein
MMNCALTLLKGYMIVEDDMTMSLEEFSKRYAREDGEPEYAPYYAHV